MNNLLLFLDSFAEYFVTFAVFGIAIVVASLLGIKVRKIKNEKEAVINTEADVEKSI